MRKTTFHVHDHIPRPHAEIEPACSRAMAEQQWDRAIGELNQYLESLADRCAVPDLDLDSMTRELSQQLHRVEGFCRTLEQELSDAASVRHKQAEFRQRTDRFFALSYLMRRARTWPRGYPGDYEIIDTTYNNQPVSPGLGALLDRYFLASTLARAIQRRREKMRDLLEEELRQRPAARVLNIGCGPCREVLELAPAILRHQAHFTNIDFDSDALLFSAQRLRAAGLADHVDFRQYNAIRMVNAQKNIREFGLCDVIYTIGLLDYLSDEVLVRLIKALYATLKPQGVFMAVFKDREHYATEDYHWLVDWSGFRQRDARESRELFVQAGIPQEALTVSRTCDDVMVFYRVVNMATVATTAAPWGPHDRRQDVSAAEPPSQRRRASRSPRPSWHRPGSTR